MTMDSARFDRVGVIGAGSTGLTIAWFLQRAGIEVEVLDRSGVAAGSSWGNAGWLTPALAGPLPEPGILRYGARAVLDRRSPLNVSLRPSHELWSFLARFARSSTRARWADAMGHLASVNAVALDAFDELADAGVKVNASDVDILAVGRTDDDLHHLAAEIAAAAKVGLDAKADVLTGAGARELEPQLTGEVGAGLLLRSQRTIDPGDFCEQLAQDVVRRGGTIHPGVDVMSVHDGGDQVEVLDRLGPPRRYDAVVVATGAWLNRLVRPYGVRVPVQAGRGYSFTLPDRPAVGRPVYLPAQRVVCTPLANGTRVAGTMELRAPDAPFREARVQQIARAVAPYLVGELGRRADEWCGSRPCSADGLPLVGPTRSPRVFVHGGHGMWGITQGPATARLLADELLGRRSEVLRPFHPLR